MNSNLKKILRLRTPPLLRIVGKITLYTLKSSEKNNMVSSTPAAIQTPGPAAPVPGPGTTYFWSPFVERRDL